MKRIFTLLLCGAMLLTAAGCRRRITLDAAATLYETVEQPSPTPMESTGQQVPSAPPDGDETKTEYADDGTPVDETIPAQGGEMLPDTPDPVDSGETVTVTLDPVGGECDRATVTVTVGGVYGVLPVPTKQGQTFQGWFREPEGGEPINEVTVVVADSDHVLYAHWTEKTEFCVTFDPNGGRISPYSAEKTVYSGNLYGELPKPIREGYTFLGWFTQPEGGEQIQSTDMVTILEDQTLYAHWEYDPYAYWSFVLENTTQKVYTCQQVKIYLELEADHVTLGYAPLITDTGSLNIAEADGTVTDDFVRAKGADVVIKLTSRIGSSEAILAQMQSRFPNARILVMPTSALEGSEAEQLYYKLRLAAICYPQWYASIDLDAAAAELGIDAWQFP